MRTAGRRAADRARRRRQERVAAHRRRPLHRALPQQLSFGRAGHPPRLQDRRQEGGGSVPLTAGTTRAAEAALAPACCRVAPGAGFTPPSPATDAPVRPGFRPPARRRGRRC
ncbi:hypothetical protein G6F68_015561 [Rhizopus microsporus]|nr:hypothetical protein G6F68_015561 [Rhizopus microsporus]